MNEWNKFEDLVEKILINRSELTLFEVSGSISSWLDRRDQREERQRREALLSKQLETLGALVIDGVLSGDFEFIEPLSKQESLETTNIEEARREPEAVAEDDNADFNQEDVIAEPVLSAQVTKEPGELLPSDGLIKEPAGESKWTSEKSTTSPPSSKETTSPPSSKETAKINQDTLHLLQNSLKSFGGDTLTTTTCREIEKNLHIQRTVLEKAVNTLGKTPESLQGRKQNKPEYRRLKAVIGKQIDHWAHAGQAVNLALTSWITKRIKALTHPQRMDLLGDVINHSKYTYPGLINGLANHHTPEQGSWLEDARLEEEKIRQLLEEIKGKTAEGEAAEFDPQDALRILTERVKDGLSAEDFKSSLRELFEAGLRPTETRLVRLAINYAAELHESEFSPLIRAIDDEIAEDESKERTPLLPKSWVGMEYTKGKRAVLIGGDSRPERLERLKENFRFQSLEWSDTTTHAVDSLIQRIKSRKVDIVLILRAFNSHKTTEKLFAHRDEEALLVLADTYGVNQIRLGIERFCGLDQNA